MKRFEGKTVLVTGGDSGIGLGIAQVFAEEGAFVYITGDDEGPLRECANKLQSIGEVRGIALDLNDQGQLDGLMQTIASDRTRLHILVNAAGALRIGRTHETSTEDFDAVFRTNVRALWMVTKAAVPLMRGSENAHILHISSAAGTNTDTGLGIYEASKSAVNTLTKVMAKELARDRIRVNAIAPGPIDTEFYKGSIYGDDAGSQDCDPKGAVPFGRMGTRQEVARLALFLASPESDFISGSITSIDGIIGY